MDDPGLVLIVDDEVQMRRLLELTLHAAGWTAMCVASGGDGLVAAATRKPDIIILDLGLPDMDGREVLRRLREWSEIPVLVLSVRDEEEQIVGCLDDGANDYLTKPFSGGELTARVRNCIRHGRAPREEPAVFSCGGLEIDFARRLVTKNGAQVHLTATEYTMLVLLVRNANRVLTHRHILEAVWGHAYVDETQYTRVYCAQLRKKIEDDPGRPVLIQTESGIGYRFVCGDF